MEAGLDTDRSGDPRARKSGDGQGIQVLARAADILRTLKDDTSGLSLGKIANRVGLPRSTVQRIVNALVAEDFISTGQNASGYKIGPEILALARAGRLDVAESLHPIMEKLSRDTGETVDLAVFRDDQMVFIDQVAGTHRLRTVSAIGDTFPMTVTANGKAALCWLEWADVERIMRSEKNRASSKKKSEEFFLELENVRVDGYALDQNEHTDGISAVGVAFSAGGEVYAISVPAPSRRFEGRKEEFTASLLDVLRQIPEVLPGADIAPSRRA